jgi:hypothetical protein
MGSPRSVRFDDDVIRRLDRYVRSHPGTSASSVTNTFVDEALRSDEHPGVVFRPGPAGRRAGLAGGPDVWEVIGTLQAVRAQDAGLAGESLVEAVGDVTGVSPRMIRVAVRYYTAYPAEIDDWIAANREAALEAEAAWRAEQDLLRVQGRAS